MQNIKPLQTSKKIMSNKEAMEELERYNPPKEENNKQKQNLETELKKEGVLEDKEGKTDFVKN